MKKISIKTPELFSIGESLKFLNRSKQECLFKVENGKLRKLFYFDEKPVLVELSQKEIGFIIVDFIDKPASEAQIQFVKKYIENWFDLNFDLSNFYNLARNDKILSPLIAKYKGLRLIGIPDFFEAISWAIIGQQINLSFAYQVKRNLVLKYGEKYTFQDEDYFYFPSPEKVLSIPNASFSEMKFSKQKMTYLQRIAKELVEQTIDLEAIKKMDYQSAKMEMLSWYGVGNWTADYILMKTFRHPKAFPIQDAGLLNALKKQLNLARKPSREHLLDLAEKWKGFEAYATFYLWRSLYD